MEPTKEEDGPILVDPLPKRPQFFGLRKALHYLMASGIYSSHLQVSGLYHMTTTDYAIHFQCKGLAGTEILLVVDYKARQEVPIGHPNFTYV